MVPCDCWISYLLLLHEFGVRHVIDNVFTEYRRGEDGIDLFGIDVLELSIENELIAFGAQVDRDLSAKKDESVDIPVLEISISEWSE